MAKQTAVKRMPAVARALPPEPQRSVADVDQLIHERVRLGIISALAGSEPLTFKELKTLLRTTDGNLSIHTRKLEAAEYIVSRKSFDGRIPKTEYQLTPTGRKKLKTYLDHMEALIQATREKAGR